MKELLRHRDASVIPVVRRCSLLTLVVVAGCNAILGIDELTPPGSPFDGGSAATAVDGGLSDAIVEASADAGLDALQTCHRSTADASREGLVLRWDPIRPGDGSPTKWVDPPLVASDCTVRIGVVRTSAAPPIQASYLERADTTPGSCIGGKGYRLLKSVYAMDAVALLAPHTEDATLFVVAVNSKGGSGSSRELAMVTQIDWRTGDDLHVAMLQTADAAGNGSPIVIHPTALALSGCDMVFEGDGYFLGATGEQDAGFRATYSRFLAPERQEPSKAEEAHYK